MTTLIFIRHGESEANRNNFFAGQINPDLMEKGIRQAELTARYIADNYKINKIYSSDLIRAYKMAQCLNELVDTDIIVRRELRKINAGKWEGVSFDALFELYPVEMKKWIEDIGNSVCPGGESVKEMGERIIKAFTRIAEENDGKTVAVATHATPIRALQSMVKSGGFELMQEIGWVSNASVTVAEYENGKWTLVKESEDGHLKELRTNLPDNV